MEDGCKLKLTGEIGLIIAYKLRFIPIILFAVCATVNLVKLSAVSIPYQDATAEMLQKHAQQISVAENWLIVSEVLFVISIVYFVVVTVLYRRYTKAN